MDNKAPSFLLKYSSEWLTIKYHIEERMTRPIFVTKPRTLSTDQDADGLHKWKDCDCYLKDWRVYQFLFFFVWTTFL